MAFTFQSQKTMQAVAVLLKREHAKRTNYMRLLKILYIADREALQQTGRTITGDRVVAMERGPVLSNVLNLIKSEHSESQAWDEYFHKDAYDIELIDDPGNGLLSRFEIRTLHDISTKFAQSDEWDLVNITHGFPEWQNNKPKEGTCNPIPVEDIIVAVGREADKDDILGRAAHSRAMDKFFGGTGSGQQSSSRPPAPRR
jgi:uncharacterized phage-associated protein